MCKTQFIYVFFFYYSLKALSHSKDIERQACGERYRAAKFLALALNSKPAPAGITQNKTNIQSRLQDKSNILVQFNQLSVSKPAHKSVIYQSSKAGKKASISIRAHGEKRKTSLKL